MKRRFFNNLLKKKRDIEAKTFHKKSKRLQQLYIEGEQQMDEDIIKYIEVFITFVRKFTVFN